MANQETNVNVNVTVNSNATSVSPSLRSDTPCTENASPQAMPLPNPDTVTVLLDSKPSVAVSGGIPTATFSTKGGDQLVVHFSKFSKTKNGLAGDIMNTAQLTCSGAGRVQAPEETRLLSVIGSIPLGDIKFNFANMGSLDGLNPNPISELCNKIRSEQERTPRP
jgi:hypothetical protein